MFGYKSDKLDWFVTESHDFVNIEIKKKKTISISDVIINVSNRLFIVYV